MLRSAPRTRAAGSNLCLETLKANMGLWDLKGGESPGWEILNAAGYIHVQSGLALKVGLLVSRGLHQRHPKVPSS